MKAPTLEVFTSADGWMPAPMMPTLEKALIAAFTASPDGTVHDVCHLLDGGTIELGCTRCEGTHPARIKR